MTHDPAAPSKGNKTTSEDMAVHTATRESGAVRGVARPISPRHEAADFHVKWLFRKEWLVVIIAATLIATVVIVCNKRTGFILAFLSTTFPLVFILVDLVLFEIKRRNGGEADHRAGSSVYYPNYRIWGTGLILGVGVTILYLFGRLVLDLLEGALSRYEGLAKYTDPSLALSNPALQKEIIAQISRDALWHNVALLFTLTAALGFFIWGIVKISQSE